MSGITHAFGALLGRLLAGTLIWIASSVSAFAATATYDILLDADNNPATGCTLTTARGDFTGVELVLSTTVDVTATPSIVTGVTLQPCESGVLGAVSVVSSDSWPVGAFARPLTDKVAVVETFLPLAELDPAITSVRAGLIARAPDGEDALLGAVLTIRRASANVAPVPTLSPLVLALLVAGLGLGGGWLARRHHASVMVLGTCVLLSAVGMAWAATMVMDGQTSDWSGAQPRMTGDRHNTNLANLWFAHDAQNAYFRIDACERTDALRGQMRQAVEGEPMEYITRSGNWSIKVDTSTITVTRSTLCQTATIQHWGHPHENLNGKHVKDWLDDRCSLLLDDGTKITMHADGPHGVVSKMSIYDGPNSFEINNDHNNVVEASTDLAVGQQRDEADADGETAYGSFVPNNTPGAIGYLDYRNIYTQNEPGPAPQCVADPVDPSCVDVPLGTTGDFYLNPNQVNDLYDDTRLGHT